MAYLSVWILKQRPLRAINTFTKLMKVAEVSSFCGEAG